MGRSEIDSKETLQSLEKIRNIVGISTLPMSLVQGKKLIVITASDQANKIANDIFTYFKKYCPNSSAVIGISRNVVLPKDYPQGYTEAKKAAEFGPHLGKIGEIIHFDDLGIIGLLFEANNLEPMKGFCEKFLGPLMEYDEKNQKDLIKTLQVFLDNESVIQSSSDELHVHYNTMKYRLKRIEEITGLNLTDAQNRLNLRLALAVFRFLHS